MKKIITILLTLFSFTAFTQVTTATEYNYMKKGFRQVEERDIQ